MMLDTLRIIMFAACWVAIATAVTKAAKAHAKSESPVGARGIIIASILSVPPLLWFSMALFHIADDFVWRICQSISADYYLIPMIGIPAAYVAIICLLFMAYRAKR